jgi:hypothetical protein
MKLTRRGWIVLVIIPAILGFAGLMWLVNHINWMGDHYCLKTMVECYFPSK